MDPVLPTFQRDPEAPPLRPREFNQFPDRVQSNYPKPLILPELILPPGTDTYILSIHLDHPLALTTQPPLAQAAVCYRNEQGTGGGYVRLDSGFAIDTE